MPGGDGASPITHKERQDFVIIMVVYVYTHAFIAIDIIRFVKGAMSRDF